MRDDSLLNTGASSASFGTTRESQRVSEKRQEQSRAKHEQRLKLKPAGEIVQVELAKEFVVLDSLSTINVGVSGEELKAEMMGRAIAKTRLEAFQTRILNILREKDD